MEFEDRVERRSETNRTSTAHQYDNPRELAQKQTLKMLTNFNGTGVGFGFGIGCGFGLGWGFGGVPFNILGLGAGGGCGVGVGLGWGFGSAFGSQYRSSKLTFQGMDFTRTDERHTKKSQDLLTTAKSNATESGTL